MKIIKTTIILILFTFVIFAERSNYQTYIATAYSLKGRMANGERVHQGAIAADWRVLPLGSKVHIKGLGTFTVKDTGGKVKGKRIDIWMPSRKAAIKFGRRKVQLRKL